MDKSARLTSPAVSQSQNWTELTFLFTGAAAGSPAVIAPQQQIAGGKVRLLVGDAAGDLLTAAQALVLVTPNSGQVSAAQQAIADKLVVWGTNVPAVADGARCVAFCVGGLGGVGEVLSVEIEHSVAPLATASAAVVRSRVLGPAVSKLSSASIAFASEGLVFWPEADVLVGSFVLEEGDNAPVAGAQVKLKVICRL
jgi:hypothetical protein